ncbi:6-bladed beta-propeller [Cyclobacterium jeungdonense]|uniref:6-bladed beta-propeller n=1 Tax=Cyclobacterium jeungdonense TaxID=708087 RepID=A0ABT8C788_9BACT|nr:6-bladed beta-propeller [Cyclobacterium jeungdonense]MDN3687914.1 6-bladed beta-propeller [Cyclobacterium jeungdonense]
MGGLFFFLLGGCKQEPTSIPGLERISVDLSQARTGKLSEFFESHIEYIWLEDDSDEAQLNGGLQKVLFHEDRIYTLDIYGCKCIHIFDKSGKHLSKIEAYGEGPGQYLDFDAAAVVDGELVLLGVYPRKIMWFSLEGEFLRELSFRDRIGPGVFSEFDDRYYLYNYTREPGDYFVKSFDKSLQDTVNYLPYDPTKLYGEDSGRSYLQKSSEYLYYGMTYSDTVYQVDNGNFIPKLVLDFGKYAQDLDEMKRLDDPRERLDFINNRAKLYFRGQYLISEKQLYTILIYEKKGINVFFDREQQQTHVIKDRIIDDIDGAYDPYYLIYSFESGKVGLKVPGRDLYKTLMEKKESMSQSDYKKWITTNGRKFSEIASAARESENPVLIVYTLVR